MNDCAVIFDFKTIISISSWIAFAVILVILVAIAIDVALSPSETVGNHLSYGKLIKTLFFIYGTIFAPGVIISIVYPIYARARFYGRPKSNAIEIISIIVATQTIFTYAQIQDL